MADTAGVTPMSPVPGRFPAKQPLSFRRVNERRVGASVVARLAPVVTSAYNTAVVQRSVQQSLRLDEPRASFASERRLDWLPRRAQRRLDVDIVRRWRPDNDN